MLKKFFQAGTIALMLAFAAIMVAALVTYNPSDPSFDTASSLPAQNILGRLGADIADFLIQWLGMCAVLPIIILLLWSWRFYRHFPLTEGKLYRFLGLHGAAAALFILSTAGLSVFLINRSWPYPMITPGGSLGIMTKTIFSTWGDSLFYRYPAVYVHLGVECFAAFLSLGTFLVTIGLTSREYKNAGCWIGRFCLQIVRLPVLVGYFVVKSVYRYLRSLLHNDQTVPALVPEAGAQEIAYPMPAAPQTMLPAQHDDNFEQQDKKELAPPQEDLEHAPRLQSSSVIPSTRSGQIVSSSNKFPEDWHYPPLSLLTLPVEQNIEALPDEYMQSVAQDIEKILMTFKVKGKITGFRYGPVVTLYEFEPEPGIRINRVVGLADDIARPLSVTSVRVAPIPGRTVIGIEVPNKKRKTVFLSELFSSSEWQESTAHLPMALGVNIMGDPIIADLAKMPHLLVAGTTGSGKSVGVNAMILSLLNKLSPQQCRLILIDPKMLEFSLYEDIPHLLTPVITDAGKTINALKWLIREMDLRYTKISKLKVRDIESYNKRLAQRKNKGVSQTEQVITGYDADGQPIMSEKKRNFEPLPYIVVIIDEAAELVTVAGKEFKICVQRLAQKARAAGIHVIMATQRPSADIIDGVIKANFPARIAFRVGQKVDSRTILDTSGAEKLLGRGDMLFMANAGSLLRVHGPFVDDGEIERTVEFLKDEAAPDYQDDVTQGEEDGDKDGDEGGDGSKRNDSVYEEAKALVIEKNKASASFLQSHLQIGWSRASRLIVWMEEDGIISEGNGSGKRRVLKKNLQPSQEEQEEC